MWPKFLHCMCLLGQAITGIWQTFTSSSLKHLRRREAVSVKLKGRVTFETVESFTDRHIERTPDWGQNGRSCVRVCVVQSVCMSIQMHYKLLTNHTYSRMGAMHWCHDVQMYCDTFYLIGWHSHHNSMFNIHFIDTVSIDWHIIPEGDLILCTCNDYTITMCRQCKVHTI